MFLKIFFDTNVISKGSFEEIQGIFDFLKENESLSRVSLFIPEIVLLEWEKHQKMKIEAINKRAADSLRELQEAGHPRVEIKQLDPIFYAQEVKEKYLKKFDIKIASIPKIVDEELIKRAIEKMPPFNPKRDGSDFGFKDTLLFFCLREEMRKNHENNTLYILMTKDGGFTESVIAEFKNENKELRVIGDLSKIKDELDVRLKLGLGLTQKRASIERVISQKREVFDLYLLARAPREAFVTMVNRENVEGYSFSSFYINDFDEIGKDVFKVSGRIIADISYKKKKPEETKRFHTWDEYESAFSNVQSVYAVPSIMGVDGWNNVILPQHETFWVSLDVNLLSGEIRIS